MIPQSTSKLQDLHRCVFQGIIQNLKLNTRACIFIVIAKQESLLKSGFLRLNLGVFVLTVHAVVYLYACMSVIT